MNGLEPQRKPHPRSMMVGWLLLALVGLLPYGRVLMGDVLCGGDALLLYLPWRKFTANHLSQWVWPLWDPGNLLGVPFLANPNSAVFYPPNLLFLVVPLPVAYAAQVFFHHAVMMVGVHRLLRTWHVMPVAALFAGSVATFNPYFVHMHVYLNQQALAWTPWILLAAHRLCVRPSLGGACVTALVVVMQLSAGELQTVYWSMLLGGAYCGIALRVNRESDDAAADGRWWTGLPWYALAILLVIAWSLVQLLPTQELGSLSDRQHGIPLELAIPWSYHPLRLVEWLVPFFYGGHHLGSPETAWGLFLHNYTNHMPWTATISMGSLSLVLAVSVVLAPGTMKTACWCLAITAVAFLLVSLGMHTPLYALLHAALPMFDVFRYPEKQMSFCTLSVALLSGLGMHRLVTDDQGGRRFTSVAMAVAGVLAAAVAALLLHEVLARDWWVNQMNLLVQPETLPMFNAQAAVDALVRETARGVATLVVSGALVWAVRTQRMERWKALAGGALLVVAELTSINLPLVVTTEDSILEPPPVVQVLRDLGVGNARIDRAPFHGTGLVSADETHLIRELGHRWETRTLNGITGYLFNLGYAHGDNNTKLQWMADLEHTLPAQAFRKLAGARWVLMGLDQPLPPGHVFRAAFPEDNMQLVENQEAMARAWMVSAARYLSSDEALLAAMADAELDHQVLLRGETDHVVDHAGSASVESARFGSQQVEVETRSGSTAFLVLSEAYAPGWQATVDGQPTPVLRANHALRAVEVPAGRHHVVFTYQPASFTWGMRLSILFGVLTLLALWVERKRGGFARTKPKQVKGLVPGVVP